MVNTNNGIKQAITFLKEEVNPMQTMKTTVVMVGIALFNDLPRETSMDDQLRSLPGTIQLKNLPEK